MIICLFAYLSASLCSKRFRKVGEQRKTEERDLTLYDLKLYLLIISSSKGPSWREVRDTSSIFPLSVSAPLYFSSKFPLI